MGESGAVWGLSQLTSERPEAELHVCDGSVADEPRGNERTVEAVRVCPGAHSQSGSQR